MAKNSDPYFSLAHNVPSGPVIESGLPRPEIQEQEILVEVLACHVSPASVNANSLRPTSAAPVTEVLLDGSFVVDIGQFQNELADEESIEPVMPIRWAFATDAPEYLEGYLAMSTPESESNAVSSTPVSQNAEGKFVAFAGAVIEIDGNEGYDYIDLSDRDITSVRFGSSSMTIQDADHRQAFTIRYRNVQHALFANGQLVELSHGESVRGA